MVLTYFGFSETFCRISMLVNWSPVGYFSCSRGVQQGDPLSAILFGLAEDFLIWLLIKRVQEITILPMHAG